MQDNNKTAVGNAPAPRPDFMRKLPHSQKIWQKVDVRDQNMYHVLHCKKGGDSSLREGTHYVGRYGYRTRSKQTIGYDTNDQISSNSIGQTVFVRYAFDKLLSESASFLKKNWGGEATMVK